MYRDVVVDACSNDRRKFAVEVVPTLQDKFAAGIMFAMMDSKSAREQVLDRVRKHLSTQTKVDQARVLWHNLAHWNYNFEAEA